MKGLLVGVVSVVAMLLVVVCMYATYSNAEVRLRNRIGAQQKKNEAVFDNTWKIIQQQAGVTSEYKDSFRQVYADIMNARYSKGDGSLMKWVQEHNPNFDSSLFKKLMTSIEVQRTIFTREQTALLDLKREHDDILQTIPSSLFVGGRPPIEVKIVTSSKTTESFSTGEDNDVDLFKRSPSTTPSQPKSK